MEALQKIEQLLNLKIGLDAKTVGESAIMSAVRIRMDEIQIDNIEQYIRLVESAADELTALIEECVVPETWFFRDGEPFEYLKQKTSLLYQKYRKLNILSMPCSTGEEPYSIAMTLLEAGLPPNSFNIMAVDISQVALDAARKAEYTKYSFRGIQDPHIIDKYFVQENLHYILKDHVKQQVTFKQLNIVDVDKNYMNHHYHIVFCRNLLIYFDNHQKKITYQNIHNMMVPGGLLMMGHAESTSTPISLFKSCETEKTFSFICREAGEYEKEQTTKNDKTRLKKKTAVNKKAKPFIHHAPHKQKNIKEIGSASTQKTKTSEPKKDPVADIQNAKVLADQGKFDMAVKICNQYTSHNIVGDDAWYLLGLINNGEGNIEHSENCFRKAIYLNPYHYEALVHLSLLLKSVGNEVAAKQFMQRANRVKNENLHRSADQS